MTDNNDNYLSAELLALRTQHQQLDEQITQLHASVSADQLKLQRLKREKLRIKDLIARVRCRLIPDLDA
ncbi:YdcH family protein [Dasania marina]|uniref:YdcH family protein n=1 Tax=Dasania marina TaxID=471499 RepID=UPI00035D472B|nr:YdcH family protein [Dasania marina]|tara:strand:- start:100202 stop:100408 length:207 start_codon:yes stop_codon:yes gene_type:complete